MMEMKEYLNEMYSTTFQADPEKYFSCGGRFEVLGNHTDHNHGLCIAATCNLSVYAAVTAREDKIVKILSEGYGYYEIDLTNLDKLSEEEGRPTALIRGIAKFLSDAGHKILGFDAYIKTEIPKGAGVSSSAGFELLIAELFNALHNDNKIPLLQLCKAGQHAENNYYGKMSGLLDQIGVGYGGLSYIDFAEFTHPIVETLDVNFNDYQFIIVNTGGSHAGLSDLYDAIPKDMFKVADYFSKGFLREVNYKDILENKKKIIEECGELPYLRAEHFLKENERVHKAYEALKLHNIPMLIKLMNESRESSTKLLQNMYVNKKAGSPLEACELIYKASNKKAGVKINGGGFAGSVIALVPKEEVSNVTKAAKDKYGKDNVYLVSIREEQPTEF